MAKAKHRIRWEPREFKQPGSQLALDFHDYVDDYGGYKFLLLITDRWDSWTLPMEVLTVGERSL